MTLKKEQFGKLDNGEQVEKVTLTNRNGVVVEVLVFLSILIHDILQLVMLQ